MFFPSRIDASHACVVRDSVDRQHIRSGASIDRMRVSVPAQIIKARHHCVLKSFVYDILAPEISHPVLNPFEV